MYANYVEHEQQEIMSTSSFCFLVFADAASEKENLQRTTIYFALNIRETTLESFFSTRVNKSYDSRRALAGTPSEKSIYTWHANILNAFHSLADKKAAQSRRERHEKCVRESLSAMLAEKVATCG